MINKKEQETNENDTPPSKEEIRGMISRFKINKIPGENSIIVEMLRLISVELEDNVYKVTIQAE